MTTSLRLTISVGLDGIPAIAISKPYMDTAMMPKPGHMVSTSRPVCVTSIRISRSGVPGNGHAPFWSSGRRSDPPIDCNTMLGRGLHGHPPLREEDTTLVLLLTKQ
jgi:hypothetical protein